MQTTETASASATGMAVPSSPKQFTVDSGARRWLAPSFTDFFFAVIFFRLFAAGEGWKGLLLDGDTGWHIRTGQWILEHGQVPFRDIFSFSKAGEPWFAWEWLTDVVYAWIFGAMQLKGIVLIGGIAILLSAVLLLRHMVWRGANALAAMVLTMLYVGAGSIHFHSRPHVVTLLLTALGFWMLDRDRAKPGRAIWLLPAIVVVWTNMHGGFLVMIAGVGLVAAGITAEEWFKPERDWAKVRRYWILLAACAAASLVNPYGIELHKHVATYLRSDWIMTAVDEFQSPKFRGEQMLQYEILLVAGILTAASLLMRREFASALLILYFAHASLSAVRHVPIFILVAAPAISIELTRLWNALVAGRDRKSLLSILDAMNRDLASGFRRTTVWGPVVLAACFLFDLGMQWPTDFAAERFPHKTVAQHSERLKSGRVLTTDQWGDYLIYHFYPTQRVFIDGRSDFYGKALGKEYLSLMNAAWNWRELADKHNFTVAMVPLEWPLATVLKTDPAWKLLADDGKALVFERVVVAGEGPKNEIAGLMERTSDAESTRRDKQK